MIRCPGEENVGGERPRRRLDSASADCSDDCASEAAAKPSASASHDASAERIASCRTHRFCICAFLRLHVRVQPCPLAACGNTSIPASSKPVLLIRSPPASAAPTALRRITGSSASPRARPGISPVAACAWFAAASRNGGSTRARAYRMRVTRQGGGSGGLRGAFGNGDFL